MEQPPFLHHPPRCVPLPHHPPPPPTQNLSEDLIFYRQNRHLVPLPLPSPLPPPYRLLVPPPSPPRLTYNHQSHFPFPNHRPIDDDLRIPHLLLEPPRLCNRRPPEFDSLPISCPDSWMDPHRMRPDNQIQFSPFPTADNLRHDLVSSLSLRNDFTDSGFIPDHDDVFLRNPITDRHGSDLDSSYGLSRDRYESISSGSSRNYAFGDSHVSSPKKSPDFESTVGRYQSFRGFVLGSDRIRSNCGDENRWGGHTRPSSINSADTCPVDAENNGFIDDANGPRVGSSRRAPHVYDSGKHNYRASREGNREFRHSRRKEMERTSALLRINFGKSNKRNRNGEQKFPSLCSNDSGPSTFRSRGPIVHTDIRVEQDGERSPVELDVSFKSNALVAKAIVASPTHEAESTRNLIRNRKLSGPEIDHSKPPPNKSNSSTRGFDCPAISYKESNHSGGNNKDTGGRDVCGIVSQPSSHHTTELPGRNTLKKSISDKGVGTVGSVGSSSRRIKKMRVNSQVLRSKANKKNVDLVEEDCRTNCSPKASQVGEDNTHLGEKHPSSGMAMVQNVDMQPSRKEVTAFLDHIIANYTATAIVSAKDECGGNSGGSDVHNSKKPRNSFTHPCSSLNPVPINSDEGTVIAVTSADLQTISNYAKGPAELQNGSTFTGSGHGSHRSCQNESPVLLQNSFSKGYFEANNICSPEEIRNHGVPVHLRTSSHDLLNGSSENGLIRGQLKITVSDMDAVGTDFKCTEATVLAKSVEVKGFPRAVPLVESNSIVSLSSAVETNIQEGVLGNGSNGSAIPTSGSYKLLSNSQSKFPVSGIGFLGDTNKGSGPDSATVLLAKVALEGAPKVTMAVGGDLHAGFGVGCTSNKGKDISYPLPSPSSGDMTTFTILDPVDTTSSYSSVDLNFAEEDVMGAGSFSAGSQSYTDMDAVATDCKCTETTVLAESVEVKGFPRAVPLVESNSIVSLSGAAETNIQGGVHGYASNSSAIPTSGSYELLSNSRSKFPVSGIGFLGDTIKGSGPDSAPVLAIVALEGAPKVTMALGGDLHTGFGVGCTYNKGKNISYPLPSPSTSDMTTFTILDPVDTTLIYSSVDLNFAEDDVLGAGNFSAGSQSSTDKDRIVHGYSPTKGSFDTDVSEEASFRIGYNGASPKYTKKRKISAPVSPSPMLSETQEESTNAGTYTLGAELLSHRGMVSNIHEVGSSRFPYCPESFPVLLGNSEAGASFEAVGFAGEGLCHNVQKEKRDLVMTKVNPQIDILDTDIGGRGKNLEEHAGMLQIEIVQQRNPVGIQAPERDQRLPLTDMECESDVVGINGLPSVSHSLSLYEHDNSVSTSDLQDEIMESAPVKPSNVDSTKTVSTVTESKIVSTEMTLGQVLNGKGYEDERKQDEKLMRKDLCLSKFLNTSLQDTTFDNKPGHAMGSVSSINAKLGPQDARETNHGLHPLSGVVSMRKNLLASAAPSVFPGHLLKKAVSARHITKPRTWRRSTDSSVPPQGQLTAKIGKDQTAAYIRKGNSLVRKPSPVATAPTVSHGLSSSVYQLNPPPVDKIKDRTGLDGTLERPNTPPLPCSPKLSNSITSLPLADPPLNGCFETESGLLTLKLYVDMPRPSDDVPDDVPNSTGPCENQIGQINNSVSQSVQDDRNSVSREAKKVVYVKRKSNQLVAASGSSDLSHQKVDQTDAPTSNGYYKRRKNQIIRKPMKITQKVSFPDDKLSSEGKNAVPIIASSSSRKRSGKGLAKTTKPSKSSLVWTLRGTESLTKENTRIHQVWPHLFPWKRATYRRSLMHTAASISTCRSLSTISQKLLLSRKRETIYTRSTQGFSLRKSKVLSFGGASLKWSKSIERTLNKANEEATLAVVAVEKKKREQNGAGAVTAGAKSRNRPSRKLVHSIQLRPDEELSNTAATPRGIKKADVPKRLHIGNDEYVRIGNGNQLIRHPKRRTRILASEKVRWSLHNARLRLAKKKKYCQFFTRFGKCDKDDGKCPYIHDPSKIAVCTKFLKGSCSDINCKLTHKVIPERMQDCSYFLQGLCTNESCPYRHVNVKPNASICEGFLRGYCADGNECRKKHSYVCPTFEATGNCALGSKCKLHHPKSRSKGKKRNSSKEEKNSRARYFGSKHFDITDSGTAVSGRHCANDNDDIFYHQGRFADYIDLGFCYEEAGEINDSAAQQMTTAPGNVGHMDIQEGGDDELIKPIYLMIRSRMIDSPPTNESPSENTAEGISFK